MGSEFYCTVLPQVEWTDDRINAMKSLIQLLEDEDVKRFCGPDDMSLEDIKEELWDALENYHGYRSRALAEIEVPGADYPIVVSGGMSWGDDPSDMFNIMSRLGSVSKVVEQLKTWAVEDKRSRKH